MKQKPMKSDSKQVKQAEVVRSKCTGADVEKKNSCNYFTDPSFNQNLEPQ